MNQKEIQELIKFVSKSGVTEVEIEEKDFKITIKSEPKKSKKNAEEKTVYIQQPMQSMPQQQMAQPMQQAAPSPAPANTPEPAAPAKAADAEESKYITVKSPMIGTFYRSPSPDKPVFVEVGDSIKDGDTVCIIEAMKLFNEIEAEIKGKIVKVLVDDATPVEYDQPLFLVDPS
ncbi:acetyl-CoA carboxylase biotin carboxyl carrier protein [Brumimicrobium salinarum]|uniref:Biotin carboxyl carrier protein of acetyl-CoA carboxylase n=1 Tax=Brumimicrobium salinarum TaxID=2058658 RepID=A0A2I0R6Y6_9FLAO|nr:acetyl-CoA carboxylase biotin carboxyl carrier protein [Brumimicrobium salinarum]PKR82342.1 acetyl-CoA carboxylase biotin carboxyl carrier protein [Brumimicrobium salinarum]